MITDWDEQNEIESAAFVMLSIEFTKKTKTKQQYKTSQNADEEDQKKTRTAKQKRNSTQGNKKERKRERKIERYGTRLSRKMCGRGIEERAYVG